MARELFNAKVETETKDKIKQLTEKYKNEGLIQYDGDLLDIAAELLERNLSVQTPRTIIGIEELDQLTSRINRLFLNLIEQNNSFIETLRQDYEDKYEKSKITIDGFIEEKQGLKGKLSEQTEKIIELNQLYEENQTKIVNLDKDNREKSKYIALLENKNKENEGRINELLGLEEQNKELILKISEKSNKIHAFQQQLIEQQAILERRDQEHRIRIQELEFYNKESMLILEKELTDKFNKHLDEVRDQRDEYVDKYNNKLSILQEKQENLFAENQKLLFEKQSISSQINAMKEENQALKSQLTTFQNAE